MFIWSIYNAIWDERWWFPANISGHKYGWTDLRNKPGSDIYVPQIWDIQWALVLGLALVLVRIVLEKIFIAPLALWLGISKGRKPNVAPNKLFEEIYKQKKRPIDFKSLSKQTDLSTRQVEVWFRDRKKQDSHTTLQKFCDSGWHFIFYLVSFSYGMYVMQDKPWFQRTIDCWEGWPLQNVTNDVYWYYMIELAFYWSLIYTLLWDPKRSDFYQMFVHHVATIVLMNFSWLVNFVRIGTLVLIVHDVADPLLELTKMVNYLKWKRTTDIVFVVFVIAWITSRHFVFPYVILYSTTFEILTVFGQPTFFNYFFNFFLYLLLALGFMWTYHLIKAVIKKLSQGEVTDTRSDSESSDAQVDNHRNGVAANGKGH
ncbi:Ceramide synthase 2 [Mactra antiquata]